MSQTWCLEVVAVLLRTVVPYSVTSVTMTSLAALLQCTWKMLSSLIPTFTWTQHVFGGVRRIRLTCGGPDKFKLESSGS